jgi:hypothetical protein
MLEAPRESIHHARELADADHALSGQIAHVRAADDGCHVMLAEGFERDVAQHDHLVVSLDLLEGAPQVRPRIGVIPREPILVGIDHALRRVAKALPLRILSGPAQ